MTSCLQSLKDIKLIQSDSGLLVNYTEFLGFLRKHIIKGSDKWKEIKKSSIDDKFKKDFVTFQDVKHVPVSSIVKFAYNHKSFLTICQLITDEIETIIFKCSRYVGKPQQSSYEETVLDLYKVVSQTDLITCKESAYSNIQSLSVRDIPSLFVIHKDAFNDTEWTRIVYFEFHFSKAFPKSTNLDLHYQIKQKNEFWKDCQKVQSLVPSIITQQKSLLRDRKLRKDQAEVLNGVYLKGYCKHLPCIIDDDVTNILREYPSHTKDFALVINCNGTCKHHQGLHLLVCLSQDCHENDLREISPAIVNEVENNHNDTLLDIIFIKERGIQSYINEAGDVQRFKLFDDTTQGRLSRDIVFHYKRKTTAESWQGSHDKCTRCYDSYSLMSLDWRSLDIEREWFLDVPLLIQIIFETFLNHESLTRTQNFKGLLSSKLTRLYATYDSLLQVYNRKHSGVIQDLNTNELVYNYHNVTTVFTITSQAGITKSLPAAERQLKKDADSDFLYWESYIKEHLLEYDTEAGFVQKFVSLRNCHLVLGLDNLVRLTFRRDPDRGQARSNQVCTLPYTLKGVPKDCLAAASWHDEAICDGSKVCACKKQRELLAKDFVPLILKQTDDEHIAFNKFSRMMTWGLTGLWQNNSSEELPTGDEQDETEDMNTSLQALVLQDYDSSDESSDESHLDLSDISKFGTEDEDNVDELSGTDSEETDESIFSSQSRFRRNVAIENDSDEFEAYENDLQIELEKSFDENIQTPSVSYDQQDAEIKEFPFKVFEPPPYIEKHPPPFFGRDDDITKLKEILDDIAFKTGSHCVTNENENRILLAPDHKIGNNLLKLIKQQKYRIYLPEFPLLHLRKSKIINLCSAYKSAGIIQLLMYMNDDDTTNEWLKLITIQNIEVATRNIRRLSMAFHMAFMNLFLGTITTDERTDIINNLKAGIIEDLTLEKKYHHFLEKEGASNATFSMHIDMMKHCDEIVAIYISEKIGGEDGYHLLLSAVKSSLPFSFLNGASSYASFCMKLLSEHYSAGPYWQGMKMSLFSSRHRQSNVNIALDTQREMDHREVLRGFRPRSTIASVFPRISLVDSFETSHSTRRSLFERSKAEEDITKEEEKRELMHITSKDIAHITPTAEMMVIKLKEIRNHKNPRNIYKVFQDDLSPSLLDAKSFSVGHQLMYRFAVQEGMFGLSVDNIPSLPTDAPKELLLKLRSCKSTTIHRAKCQQKPEQSSQKSKETKRKTEVKRAQKSLDCLFSAMNTCQAILKPDCTKANVPKSSGIKTAISNLIEECLPITQGLDDARILYESKVPDHITSSVRFMVLEFAGVKFKIPEKKVHYLEFIQRSVIGKLRHQFPFTNHMVICEEKYSYTPDDLKASTREKRNPKSDPNTIAHLKPTEEIISSDVINRKAVTTTSHGKQAISLFLSQHIEELSQKNVILDVDSEAVIRNCDCTNSEHHVCSSYTVPVRATFGSHGFVKKEELGYIKQRKGEAEMAQVDWLIEQSSELEPGESVLSVVTSGDIDALIIHLFAVSRLWPRTDEDEFKNDVYLMLQKPSQKFDLYSVTTMIRLFEKKLGRDICPKIAVSLCIGGNDFIPKYAGYSHNAVLKAYLSEDRLSSLINERTINEKTFIAGIQRLYCPKMYSSSLLSFEELRQFTIKHPGKSKFNSPERWMPPITALKKICALVQCQLDYLLMAGHSDAILPDFISYGCLVKDDQGSVSYNLGDDVRVEKKEDLITIAEEELKERLMVSKTRQPKRKPESTPQKGERRKRAFKASTPRQSRR